MPFLADLHVHSYFSRATSRKCNVEGFYLWAQLKGVRLVATGDMTHPSWQRELQDKLIPAAPGLFRLRPELAKALDRDLPPACRGPVDFILSGEISSIYKKAGKCRKIHNLVYAPDFESLARFTSRLDRIGNITSDGRPILGLDARDLLEILLETVPEGFLIPAHIWTPWFSMLGAKSGFASPQDCFEDLAPHIFAAETGLSSDPPMNWRIASLDELSLVSNSDLHSPEKLGRNANVFHCEANFFLLRDALKNKNLGHFGGTIDIFPEEGKYHLDGHRKCGVSLDPEESRRVNRLCPVCSKPLVQGVLHRVEELADRRRGFRPVSALPHEYIIPLDGLLAEIHGCGNGTKKVRGTYFDLLARFGPELDLLRTRDLGELKKEGFSLLHEAVSRVRRGQVIRTAGFDGEYGKIRVFEKAELDDFKKKLGLLPGGLPARKKRIKNGDEKSETVAGRAREAGVSIRKGNPFPLSVSRMVVSDFDGTLLRSDGTMNQEDLEALEELGRKGVVRVIATGRSLFSLNKVLPKAFPTDYIIFSTGSGISAYRSNRLLTSAGLQPAKVRFAVQLLQELQLDFSIQQPIPRNHYFQYWLSGRSNPDFEHRLELYRDFCQPLSPSPEALGPAAQLIAILPPEQGSTIFSQVRERLPDLTVVRATSPLDHKSVWTEIFPPEAGKGKAVAWLAARLGIPVENILAIGNDFNDIDMLELAGTGFLVDNAPFELKQRYPTVAANNLGGVAEAIGRWLARSADF